MIWRDKTDASSNQEKNENETKVNYVGLLNEMSQLRKWRVEYVESGSGTSFTTVCKIDGVEKGEKIPEVM